MCRSFIQTGDCSYGDRCKFTHGPGDTRELRSGFPPRPGPSGPSDAGGDELMTSGAVGGMGMTVRLLLEACQLNVSCACRYLPA